MSLGRVGVEVFAQCRCLSYKGRACMAVGRVLIAVANVANRYSAEKLHVAYL